MPRRFSNNGFGGLDPLTYWCATESEAWELLRCSRKNSQCQGRRWKQQLHILRGRRVELSRGSQPSRKWRARRFCNTKCHVSCQLRCCLSAESKSREVGHTKETSWQDVSSFGRQRERPWKKMLLRKRSEEQLPQVPGR